MRWVEEPKGILGRLRGDPPAAGRIDRASDEGHDPPPQGLRVFISVDLEGVAGAVSPEQLGPVGFEYGRFREFMTDQTLGAIEGVREAGATEFGVADAHPNGQDLLIERFPDDVETTGSWPRPPLTMEGIDETFDAPFFIGHHAAAQARIREGA
jgi:D-amino peptidase